MEKKMANVRIRFEMQFEVPDGDPKMAALIPRLIAARDILAPADVEGDVSNLADVTGALEMLAEQVCRTKAARHNAGDEE
jgi:hypothetical protein